MQSVALTAKIMLLRGRIWIEQFLGQNVRRRSFIVIVDCHNVELICIFDYIPKMYIQANIYKRPLFQNKF